MTPKHRKILLICLGIVAGSYIVHSAIEAVIRLQNNRRQAAIRAQRAKQKPSPMPPANDLLFTFMTVPAEVKGLDARRFVGVWGNKAVLNGRGICDLRFELKEGETGSFVGFSTFNCVNYVAIAGLRNPTSIESAIAHRMKQDAAILTGSLQDGSIYLRLERAVVGDPANCAVQSFVITPFGDKQLAAEWQDRTCPGGSMLLERMRS